MFLRFNDKTMMGLHVFEEINPPAFNSADQLWSVRGKRVDSQSWFTLFTSDKKERAREYFDNLCQRLEDKGMVIDQKEIEP